MMAIVRMITADLEFHYYLNWFTMYYVHWSLTLLYCVKDFVELRIVLEFNL